MLGWWTVSRASGIGVTACLVALLLWPWPAGSGDVLFWLFAAAALVTAVCGASILLITAADTIRRSRGYFIRPVRIFDVVVGAGLLGLSFLQFHSIAGRLPV